MRPAIRAYNPVSLPVGKKISSQLYWKRAVTAAWQRTFTTWKPNGSIPWKI
jgi:hypothetical protein